MHYLRINGGKKLSGSVKISGAKNAALPLIALSILSKNEVVIKNLPAVSDIHTLIQLLSNLGAKCEFLDANTAKIDPREVNSTKAIYDIVRKMRASILVLGPLLARFRHCEVSLPGGCAIGARPIDLVVSYPQDAKDARALLTRFQDEIKDSYEILLDTLLANDKFEAFEDII